MKQSTRSILYLLFCLMLFSAIALVIDFVRFMHTRLPVTPPYIDYILQPGETLTHLANDLYTHGLLKHQRDRYYLRLLVAWRGQTRSLKAGEYRIDKQTTPSLLVARLARGDVLYHEITFIEGWTFARLIQALTTDTHIRHTVEGIDEATLMQSLGSERQKAEGLFYPETYHFTRGTSDVELLQRAFTAMQQRLAQEWAQRAQDLPYKSPYDALIAASLIEKETGRLDEQAKIARVLVLRLQKHMRLQFDPTVIYGLGKQYTGNLTRKHLRQDNPYNTYRRKGLPPTPIALPGGSALHAALHPAPGNYLYFVARGDGSHVFSSNLQAHQRAVHYYQRRGRVGG